MANYSEQQNPDVNSFNIGNADDEDVPATNGHDSDNQPIESIPVPPDRRPTVPVEEPPESDEPPIEEDESSPQKIA